jgi:hypothetical protein
MGEGTVGDGAAPGASKPTPALPKPGALDVELTGPDRSARPPGKVVVAARALGIETEGKSDRQLRDEIAALLEAQRKNEASR